MKETEVVARIKEIAERLNRLFPEVYRPERTPEEQIVFTILSQNTTDKNAEKCLENLKRLTNGDLKSVIGFSQERLIETIKPCGMYNQKVKAIISIMKDWESLKEKLKELPVQEAIKLLTSYPYIGTKTARVVLSFSFNKNTFPVDTHCYRVLKRLGIFPENRDKDKISEFMEEHFDTEFNRKFHYNLIRLGRTICRARKPECGRCPLKDLCRFYGERKKSPKKGT